MSAFTNWNGPGDCCGGGSSINNIPQIAALNELIAKYDAVLNTIRDLQVALEQHAAMPASVSSGGQPHAALQAAIVTLQNAVATIGSPGSYGTLSAYIAAVKTIAEAAQNTANSANTAAGNALSTANSALSTANSALSTANSANSKIGAIKTGYTTISAWLTAVEATVNALKLTWTETNDALTLTKKLKALDILCQNIELWWQLDFNNWKSSASILTTSNTGTNPYIICELKDLDKHDNTTLQSTGYARKKPGRVYVRSVDTQSWSAIIDAVCASNSTGTRIRGALTALATKTQASATTGIGKLKFGIYYGTSSDGAKHIYLGVVHDPAIRIRSPAMHFCGENVDFVEQAPTNRVTTLAETAWVDGSGGTAFAELHVEKIYSDNYYDAKGNGVAVTKDDTLTIGNDSHETIIVSSNRPPVSDDEGNHQLAYLSDLHNSIVWQRAVKVYTETLAVLQAAKVWVTGTAPDYVVVKDGTAGATQVPGVYFTQHESTYNGPVAGYVFQANDIALVKTSTLANNTQKLADGKVNATISGTTMVPVTALIGFAAEGLIKADSTTVVDNVGNYGRITAYTTGGTATITPISQASLPTYTKPMYAKFNGSTWAGDANIDIPEATDGYVSPLTYEWSGHHLSILQPNDDYYTPSYIMWTPHYQVNTMNWVDVEEWSFIDITLAGVRDAAQQDVIDRALQAIGQTQADYANFQQVKAVQIPGQPLSMQPDPSFIHNKPWVGLAVLEGGGFNQPTYQSGWMVDGGDYTGLSGIVRNPAIAPPVSPDDSFRNVLIKVLHGRYEDMPEVKMLTDGSTIDQQNAIRANYAFQLRICAQSADSSKDGLYYSDGVNVYQINGTAI